MELTRNAPQNISAEQAALGSIILDKESILNCIEILKAEDFYRNGHQIIYQCALDLFEKNQAVDLITLTEELKRRKQLDEIGGASYLTTLMSSVPTAANVTYYAKIVEEKAILRKLINHATQIVAMGYEEQEDAPERGEPVLVLHGGILGTEAGEDQRVLRRRACGRDEREVGPQDDYDEPAGG